MKKIKILVGVFLLMMLFFAVNYFTGKSKEDYPVLTYNDIEMHLHYEDYFTWQVKVYSTDKNPEVYYTNETVVRFSEGYDGTEMSTPYFRNLHQIEWDKKGWNIVGPVDEEIPMNVPLIITQRVNNHDVHKVEIQRKLEPGTPVWKIAVCPNDNYLETVWRTQEKPVFYKGFKVSMIGIENPYTKFGDISNGNGIGIPLFEKVIFVNVPNMISIDRYDKDDYIYVMHFTLNKNKNYQLYKNTYKKRTYLLYN